MKNIPVQLNNVLKKGLAILTKGKNVIIPIN